MIIFALREHYQECDGDMYSHWIASKFINYYVSKELANIAIETLLLDTEYLTAKVWDAKLGDGRNIISLTEETNGILCDSGYKDVIKYFITPIEVLE